MVVVGGSRGVHQNSMFRGVCCRVVDQLLWTHVRGHWGNIDEAQQDRMGNGGSGSAGDWLHCRRYVGGAQYGLGRRRLRGTNGSRRTNTPAA